MIEDDVAVAGLLTNDDILSEAINEDENYCSDDSRDKPLLCHTVQEAAGPSL